MMIFSRQEGVAMAVAVAVGGAVVVVVKLHV